MVERGKVLSAFWYALISLGGAGLAQLWFTGDSGSIWLGVGLLVATALAGYLIGYCIPEWSLFPNRPILAAAFVELWILFPGTLAAAMASVVIVISVNLVPVGTDAQKEITHQISSALTALLASIFLKVFEDADEDITGTRARTVFYEHYKAANDAAAHGVIRFTDGSPGLLAVYSDAQGTQGWGFDARHKRAAQIAERLTADSIQ